MELSSCESQGGEQVHYWDSFFRARNGRAIEWYSDWTDLQGYMTMLVPKSAPKHTSVPILVVGCGNSELSALMYDAGWQNIINVDFSKVVIAEMLRLHVRSRPHMRWQVMDMSHLQFADACFDVVLDKGSLDSLMGDATECSVAARSYLSEVSAAHLTLRATCLVRILAKNTVILMNIGGDVAVVLDLGQVKRVLRPGGKYACVTAAQSNVLGLLLMTFRQGWLLYVHKILLLSNNSNPQLQPYLFYAIKISTEDLAPVQCFFGNSKNTSAGTQMHLLVDSIKEENLLRSKGWLSNPSDVFGQLFRGRRTSVKLAAHYPAVVLDAKPDAEPPALRCGVFLVPKSRAHEWLFSSEEGEWQVIETVQAGRLILVTLDAQQTDMDSIKQELSPLVKPFLPLDCRDSDSIPYMTTNDAVSQRILLEEIESPMTGTIQVEEVVVLSKELFASRAEEPKSKHYRRLVFRRNPNLIQSEAFLISLKVYSNGCDRTKNGTDVVRRHSGNKKKQKAKVSALGFRTGFDELRIDFSYLASEYHAGIISGLSLIAHKLDEWISAKEPRRAMIVGLGAGLLPMFIHNHIPVDTIQFAAYNVALVICGDQSSYTANEVIELDGVVGDVAKRHFGFVENERMQLYIGDGIEAVFGIARRNSSMPSFPRSDLLEENLSTLDLSSRKSTNMKVTSEVDSKVLLETDVVADPFHSSEIYGPNRRNSSAVEKLHILIIDADSEDPSKGLSCPPAEFLEEPFLRSAKDALVDGGILAINVVSRASSPHITSVALLQKVFEEVYDLEIEEHVNRVLFARPHHSRNSHRRHRDGQMQAEVMEESRTCFERLARAFAPWENGPSMEGYVQRLNRLK